METPVQQLIDRFKQLNILVVGDAILDTYINGTQDRFCREAPVPVFNVLNRTYQCGGAANTAINAALLGATTYFVTVLGRDAHARELEEVLKRNKVRVDGIIRDKARITVAKQRLTTDAGMVFRMDEGSAGCISEGCRKAVVEKIAALLPMTDIVVLSDYGYGLLTDELISNIQALLEEHRKPVVVDAKDLARYRALSPLAVKPNYEETLLLLKAGKVARSKRIMQITNQASQLFAATGAAQIAATLDADGVLFLGQGKAPVHIPCVAREHNKTIGAGDTFVAALALSLAAGANGKTAAEIAAAAASVAVQKEGTSGCTCYELKHLFEPVPKYIASVAELEIIVAELRRKGKCIVFTNGCFDILHKGHVSLLQQAKEAGDVLLVAVNTDSSIHQLKGKGRPVNNFEDRITVLAGLQSVDYIIPFNEQTPLHLIKTIRPDVFVKGSNYSEDSIPEMPLLKRMGCSIKIVPYVVDHSTTHLINRIRSTEPAVVLHP